MATNKGFKVTSGEARHGRRLAMKGVTANVIDVKISSKDSKGELTLLEVAGARGGPPLHIHPSQDEVIYVLNGEYLWQVGDERFQITTGDTLFLPRAVPHAFKQLTEKGTMLISYYPSGQIERYFQITDAWLATPSEPEIRDAFEAGGMRVVGPPL